MWGELCTDRSKEVSVDGLAINHVRNLNIGRNEHVLNVLMKGSSSKRILIHRWVTLDLGGEAQPLVLNPFTPR